jgi:hypothetical protein
MITLAVPEPDTAVTFSTVTLGWNVRRGHGHVLDDKLPQGLI